MIFIIKSMNMKKIWALLVFTGVAVGTILLNMVIGFRGTALTEQVEQFHRLVQNQLEPSIGVWLRICFYRMGAAVMILACIRFMGNYYIFYPVVFAMSLSFGYTLSLLSYRYGVTGLVYMFAYTCPQYFVYIPLFVGILREASDRMDRALPGSLRRTLVIFTIIFAGCLVESYMNPMVLKIILKNF